MSVANVGEKKFVVGGLHAILHLQSTGNVC